MNSILISILIFLSNLNTVAGDRVSGIPAAEENKVVTIEPIYTYTYSEVYKESGLKEDAFENAIGGYSQLQNELTNLGIISIIDYSLPSTQERFWIIDLNTQTVLFRSLVAHGRNSGSNFATKFSNQKESFMSSPGFFITGKTYFGKHGLSLNLEGVEPGINDNAAERALVIHGANYVSRSFISKHGRLGRSLGCPAVPEENSTIIISLIANGTCIFINPGDSSYPLNSTLLGN